MRIAAFTNVYPPQVGGVERSVESTAGALRALGHDVMVVAPQLAGARDDTGSEIFRVPSLEDFAGTGFALPLPTGEALARRLDDFAPQVIHAHHPFLLGDVALHEATARGIPIVFTYHTRYELLAGPESQGVAGYQRVVLRVAQSLALGYCDLCDGVVAPSRSVARFLRDSGVETAISVIPTGIDTERFQSGDRGGFRASYDLDDKAFVVGHVGRLAPEKNLSFLLDGVSAFLEAHREARFVLVGGGPMDTEIVGRLRDHGVADRVVLTGALSGSELADAYAAMDVFAFASRSETQGLVVAEAMAAGLPVVCLDAPGVGEIVDSGVNGLKLPADSDPQAFADALRQLATSSAGALSDLRHEARRTAAGLSLAICAGRLAELYADLCAAAPVALADDRHRWAGAVARFSDDIRNTATQAWSLGRAILPDLTDLGRRRVVDPGKIAPVRRVKTDTT
jgi:1,2-diacylglycerol 3-alpha-glucosyltransferase